jgi:tetratricopeptide (TPR) repeat protein
MTAAKNLTLGLALACLTLCLAATPATAAGEESMPVAETPAPSPEQMAVSEYNAGVDRRDEAHELDEKLAAGADEKKQAKYETKRAELFEKAVGRFEAAVAKKPDFHQAHSALGYSLRRLGRHEEAMAAYDEALRLNPNYPEATEYRAEALLGLGRVEEAQEAYERLAIVSPDHAAELLSAFKAFAADSDTGAGSLADWIAQRESVSGTTSSGGSADPGSWP